MEGSSLKYKQGDFCFNKIQRMFWCRCMWFGTGSIKNEVVLICLHLKKTNQKKECFLRSNCEIMVLGVSPKGFEVAKNDNRSCGEANAVRSMYEAV